MSDVEANRALAAHFFETFSAGDMRATLDLLDDGASWVVAGKLEGVSGRYSKAQMARLLEGTRALYKGNLQITPTAIVADGNRVAIEAEGFAELTDGRLYEPGYNFHLIIRGGKIVEVREYMDLLLAKELFFS
jgi:ketosteroid isomerase-like protein